MSKVRLGIVDGFEYVIEQSDLEAVNKAHNEHIKESVNKKSLCDIVGVPKIEAKIHHTDFYNDDSLEKYIQRQLIDSLANPKLPEWVVTGTGTPRKRPRPITRNKRKHIKP